MEGRAKGQGTLNSIHRDEFSTEMGTKLEKLESGTGLSVWNQSHVPAKQPKLTWEAELSDCLQPLLLGFASTAQEGHRSWGPRVWLVQGQGLRGAWPSGPFPCSAPQSVSGAPVLPSPELGGWGPGGPLLQLPGLQQSTHIPSIVHIFFLCVVPLLFLGTK